LDKKSRRASQTQSRPNVFIVGSMKCGTTILYDFLTAHDQIKGGVEKEIHYFSLYHEKGDDWYAEKFPEVESATHRVDASPTYLDMCLSVPTAERIKSFNPDAKIIILHRNPIQRAISHFNHLKKINKIPELNNLSFDDLIDRNWPSSELADRLESTRQMIIDFSKYEEKIKRFLDVFGKEKVFVVSNEDLRVHGDTVVRQIYDFIGIGAPEGVDFSQQKYLHGSNEVSITQRNFFALLEELGDDYYRACRVVNCRRPQSPTNAIRLNEPTGTLVNSVGVGEAGWLFLATGSSNVLEMYTESEERHFEIVSRWHRIVLERVQNMNELGSRYMHMMIPEKLTLLGDKLHWPIDTGRSRGATFYNTAPPHLKDSLIDLVGYMKRLPDREKYFLQTDSHWNFFGAFAAYQLVSSALGISCQKELLNRKREFGRLVLDLGSKLPDHPAEDVFFSKVRKEASVVNDAGLVRYKKENNYHDELGLHVGSFIHFQNLDAPNSEKIVIFGDSFSEYRDHLLTALMAETFRETIFVWSSQVDYGVIKRYRPDLVFCFMTERFTDREVDDSFDYVRYTTDILSGYSN
jgi:alginate O-acetyltransferase complex protein AlgJ